MKTILPVLVFLLCLLSPTVTANAGRIDYFDAEIFWMCPYAGCPSGLKEYGFIKGVGPFPEDTAIICEVCGAYTYYWQIDDEYEYGGEEDQEFPAHPDKLSYDDD